MSIIFIFIGLAFAFCITMVIGGIVLMVVLKTFMAILKILIWLAESWENREAILDRLHWLVRQPLLFGIIVLVGSFLTSVLWHIIGYEKASNIFMWIAALTVYIAPPAEVIKWLVVLVRWGYRRRRPESSIGTSTQAEFHSFTTLVQNNSGVYVPQRG